MDELNIFEDSSFEQNDNTDEDKISNKLEKVLCSHCGRTKNNGIRCLGICVADNDY
tara:strand:+ start:1635 stop:1802 length:168 start_codon:yes stop_codon:yes gene_type:complete